MSDKLLKRTEKPRNLEEVEQAQRIVDQIRETGTMPDDSYYKLMVSLAYEYIQAGEHQRGLVLLMKPPPSYYTDTQPQQMQSDEMYKELVIVLAYRLIQLGVIDGADQVFVPNVAPARA